MINLGRVNGCSTLRDRRLISAKPIPRPSINPWGTQHCLHWLQRDQPVLPLCKKENEVTCLAPESTPVQITRASSDTLTDGEEPPQGLRDMSCCSLLRLRKREIREGIWELEGLSANPSTFGL